MPADLPGEALVIGDVRRRFREFNVDFKIDFNVDDIHPSPAVLHDFGPQVRIYRSPEDQPVDVNALSRDGRIPDDLTATEILGLEAFALRSSEQFAKAKSARPLDGELWNTNDAFAPDPPGDGHAPAGPTPNDIRSRSASPMTGQIGVGLVMIDGPTPDVALDKAKRDKIFAEVQHGLSFLGTLPGPGVTWSYDVQVVDIATPPDPTLTVFEDKEALWRDPALAILGYAPGMAGVESYLSDVRARLGVGVAYAAFFTRYPLGYYAYAAMSGRLVMQYENGLWLPDNIDRVFAHETAHIFGAPDEYSPCNCGGSWGASAGPNSNCEDCAPNGGVKCIMLANTKAMCDATRGHIGW